MGDEERECWRQVINGTLRAIAARAGAKFPVQIREWDEFEVPDFDPRVALAAVMGDLKLAQAYMPGHLQTEIDQRAVRSIVARLALDWLDRHPLEEREPRVEMVVAAGESDARTAATRIGGAPQAS